jgi:hypothetical protein
LWRRHRLLQQDVAVQPGQRDGWRFVQVVPCRDHRRVGETAGAGRVRSIGEGARGGDPGLRGESFAPAGIGLRHGDDAGAAAGDRVPRVGDPARPGAGHDQADGHRVLLCVLLSWDGAMRSEDNPFRSCDAAELIARAAELPERFNCVARRRATRL